MATARKVPPPTTRQSGGASTGEYLLSAEAALKLLQQQTVDRTEAGVSVGGRGSSWMPPVIELGHPWQPSAVVNVDTCKVTFTYEVDSILHTLQSGVYVVRNGPGAVWADIIVIEVKLDGTRRCWLLQCKRYKQSNLLCPADWNRAAWLMCGNEAMLATANADDEIVKDAWPDTSKRNRGPAPARGFLIAPPRHHPVAGSFLVGVHSLRPQTCHVPLAALPEITIDNLSEAVKGLWRTFAPHEANTFADKAKRKLPRPEAP